MRGTDTIKNNLIQAIKSLRDFIKHGYAVQKTEIHILPSWLGCTPYHKIAGECWPPARRHYGSERILGYWKISLDRGLIREDH